MALWLIVILNYFAVRYINKCTKMMQVSSMVANLRLRFFYVGFFGAAALFNSVALLLEGLAMSLSLEKENRWYIAGYCFLLSKIICIMGAHFCMLIMFI